MLKRFPNPGRQIFLTIDQEKLERGEAYRNPEKHQQRAWELVQKYSKKLKNGEKVVLSTNEMTCFLLYALGNPASLETESSISKIESHYGAILRIQNYKENSYRASLQRFCTDSKFFLLANSPSVRSNFIETLHFFFSQPDLLNFLDEIFNYYITPNSENVRPAINQRDIDFIYLLSVALDYYDKYTDDLLSKSKIELRPDIVCQIIEIKVRLNKICSRFEYNGKFLDRSLIKERLKFLYIYSHTLFDNPITNQVKKRSEITVVQYKKNELQSISQGTIIDVLKYKNSSQSQRDHTKEAEISKAVAKGTSLETALEEGASRNNLENLAIKSHLAKMQRSVIREIETLHDLSLQKLIYIDPILIYQFILKNYSYINVNGHIKLKLRLLVGKIKKICEDKEYRDITPEKIEITADFLCFLKDSVSKMQPDFYAIIIDFIKKNCFKLNNVHIAKEIEVYRPIVEPRSLEKITLNVEQVTELIIDLQTKTNIFNDQFLVRSSDIKITETIKRLRSSEIALNIVLITALTLALTLALTVVNIIPTFLITPFNIFNTILYTCLKITLNTSHNEADFVRLKRIDSNIELNNYPSFRNKPLMEILFENIEALKSILLPNVLGITGAHILIVLFTNNKPKLVAEITEISTTPQEQINLVSAVYPAIRNKKNYQTKISPQNLSIIGDNFPFKLPAKTEQENNFSIVFYQKNSEQTHIPSNSSENKVDSNSPKINFLTTSIQKPNIADSSALVRYTYYQDLNRGKILSPENANTFVLNFDFSQAAQTLQNDYNEKLPSVHLSYWDQVQNPQFSNQIKQIQTKYIKGQIDEKQTAMQIREFINEKFKYNLIQRKVDFNRLDQSAIDLLNSSNPELLCSYANLVGAEIYSKITGFSYGFIKGNTPNAKNPKFYTSMGHVSSVLAGPKDEKENNAEFYIDFTPSRLANQDVLKQLNQLPTEYANGKDSYSIIGKEGEIFNGMSGQSSFNTDFSKLAPKGSLEFASDVAITTAIISGVIIFSKFGFRKIKKAEPKRKIKKLITEIASKERREQRKMQKNKEKYDDKIAALTDNTIVARVYSSIKYGNYTLENYSDADFVLKFLQQIVSNSYFTSLDIDIQDYFNPDFKLDLSSKIIIEDRLQLTKDILTKLSHFYKIIRVKGINGKKVNKKAGHKYIKQCIKQGLRLL